MPVVPSLDACPFCQAGLPAQSGQCPQCQASPAWVELGQAVDFASQQFEEWTKANLLERHKQEIIGHHYSERRQELAQALQAGQPQPPKSNLPSSSKCWGCETRLGSPAPFCPDCGVPLEDPRARLYRFLVFLPREIQDHTERGYLSLNQAHGLIANCRERRGALRRQLEKDRQVLDVLPLKEEDVPQAAGTPAAPRRPLLEILLDPRNIQWLLIFGAGMLVLGLIIYLYTAGVFENKIVVASLMGVGTVGLLAGGGALVVYTRYQIAGRAVTLLACLIMPLNLWFYHAQGLHPLTLYEHLWVAALVVCALYAAAAWVLKDPMFVYVLVAGVTMTGLLILADVDGQEMFWQITHPATLLVVLGLVAVHVERAFPVESEGPFTRKRFGLAFFWSGHVVLAAGLLLVLGAQVVGYVYTAFQPFFVDLGLKAPSPVASERSLQILALCLILSGTYVYFYSDLVVRRIGAYIYLAVFTLLWAEALIVQMLAYQIRAEWYIVALALTALAANVLQFVLVRREPAAGEESGAGSLQYQTLVRAAAPLGIFLTTLPVLLGLSLFLRSTYAEFNRSWPYSMSWSYVGAMLATAVSCRFGAHVYRQSMPRLSLTYFFGTAAATLVAAAGFLRVRGLDTWDVQAPVLMVIPIIYLLAARLYRGHVEERPLTWVAHVAVEVMLLAVLGAALQLVPAHVVEPLKGAALNPKLAGFFAEATLFYILAALFSRQGAWVYLATATACGTLWQMLNYWSVPGEVYTLAFAFVGLGLLVAYRFAMVEKFNLPGLSTASFQCANALLSLAFVAGALLTLTEIAANRANTPSAVTGMLCALVVSGLLSAALVRQPGWRRWYIVTVIGETSLLVLVFAVVGRMSSWEKLEIANIVLGLILLGYGHVGWYREQDKNLDSVSFSLPLGSLMTAVPMTVAMIYFRSRDIFFWPNELGTLALGIVLLATGVMFRLKSTTLTGTAQLTVYILTLLVYLPWDRVSTAAICLMAGGGVVFGAGLVLSVYRDRLLALPDKIKRREGVFHVLSWR